LPAIRAKSQPPPGRRDETRAESRETLAPPWPLPYLPPTMGVVNGLGATTALVPQGGELLELLLGKAEAGGGDVLLEVLHR
jgi:hypothetical protein